MTIVSLPFAGFVILSLAVYYFLPRRRQNQWLLLTSLIFYATWCWYFPLILLALAALNYTWAQQLPQARNPRGRLWLGIGFNLLVLTFFKYADFFRPDDGILRILLPVGLSFYVLQAISYLVDVSRRQAPPDAPFTDFALYLVYFPKLTAGPIERARPFLVQLAQPRRVDNEKLTRSFTLILIGLVRKVVVADLLLANLPPEIFEHPGTFSAFALAAWMFTWLFGFYNDFAGYTNIVRGVSGLFGIELNRNFAHPLFARNFVELWNRWHISLSHWLRDYIYFPVNRALLRRNPSRTNLSGLVLPPLVTMIASGIWHGVGWHFLIWGSLMGLFQIIERLPSLWWPVRPPGQRPMWLQFGSMTLVIVLFALSGLFFQMETPIAREYLLALFDWGNGAPPDSNVFLFVIPALAIDIFQYHSDDELVFLKWPWFVQATLLTLALLSILLSSLTIPATPFIYQGF